MTTERTAFAENALEAYLDQPTNAEYSHEDETVNNLVRVSETDAFVAGWEASIDHLHTVVNDLDIPGPAKAIIESILNTNRAEREVKN